MSVKGSGREIKSCLHIEKREVPNVFTAEKPSPVGSNGSSEDPLRYRRLVNRLLRPALPLRTEWAHTLLFACASASEDQQVED